RAADELGLTTKEQQRGLRDLKPGTFFAFGPALAAGVSAVQIGPVETTHPKAGARIAFTPPAPTAAVKALLPKLADLPAEAEQRQRSLDDLRKDNAELRRQLTVAQRSAPPKIETKVVQSRVEVPVVPAADMLRLERAATKIVAALTAGQQATNQLVTRMKDVATAGQRTAPKVVPAPRQV